jgi:hypothetical protein
VRLREIEVRLSPGDCYGDAGDRCRDIEAALLGLRLLPFCPPARAVMMRPERRGDFVVPSFGHGSELRLTPSPPEQVSYAFDRRSMPPTAKFESRNTRYASLSSPKRNSRNLFPRLSPWFVNLDSVPCKFWALVLTAHPPQDYITPIRRAVRFRRDGAPAKHLTDIR